ncbi:MAG: hypothetical protein AAF402_03215 [Pseudomonadota bacterium]
MKNHLTSLILLVVRMVGPNTTGSFFVRCEGAGVIRYTNSGSNGALMLYDFSDLAINTRDAVTTSISSQSSGTISNRTWNGTV